MQWDVTAWLKVGYVNNRKCASWHQNDTVQVAVDAYCKCSRGIISTSWSKENHSHCKLQTVTTILGTGSSRIALTKCRKHKGKFWIGFLYTRSPVHLAVLCAAIFFWWILHVGPRVYSLNKVIYKEGKLQLKRCLFWTYLVHQIVHRIYSQNLKFVSILIYMQSLKFSSLDMSRQTQHYSRRCVWIGFRLGSTRIAYFSKNTVNEPIKSVVLRKWVTRNPGKEVPNNQPDISQHPPYHNRRIQRSYVPHTSRVQVRGLRSVHLWE